MFWRDTPIPIALGANVVVLIAQDKQNAMGVRCYMEAPYVLRRTTVCLLPVCRLACQVMGSALPALLVIYPPTPMSRAPMGVVVVDGAPSTCRGLLVVPHDG